MTIKSSFTSCKYNLSFDFFKQESDMQFDQVLLGKAAVPFNPTSQLLPVSSSAILSIPNTNFKGSKGFSKTYILMIQVGVPYRIPIKGAKKARKDSSSHDNGIYGDISLAYYYVKILCIAVCGNYFFFYKLHCNFLFLFR